MSNSDVGHDAPRRSLPPLSWPPPGLERLQGRLWRVIGFTWVGALVLVAPLLWELATEQPFWSLGPFEGNWQVGMAITVLGLVVLTVGFGYLIALLKDAAAASRTRYGTLTILEVATDLRRDTGFLIQGLRHFGGMDTAYRAGIVRARLRGAAFVLAAGLWVAVGFGLAVLLAARGFLTAPGVWLATLGPAGLLLLVGAWFLLVQNNRVRNAHHAWAGQEGADRIRHESAAWAERLDEAGDRVAMGAGPKNDAARFATGALAAGIMFLVAVVPTAMVAVTGAIGPILAEIAVPQFLSVQEMAGAAEVLRRYRLEQDGTLPAGEVGSALQNLAFVGGAGTPEPWEQPPATRYEGGWFPEPDLFPDPFSESVARDLMTRGMASFSEEEAAALRQAAEHPAQAEFEILARAPLVDVVSSRWQLPFPDTVTFQSLPWPRFAAFRTAGLARVARAAVQADAGDVEGAERTLQELISTGLLLVDEGPTLIDNLMGVVLANMGGDALEGLYESSGRTADARALRWSREGAQAAASKARAGLVSEDIHSLLQGIPDLVVDDEPLRGLRWEYFATFNMLAPCINVHKMVFGPDETYDDWRLDARDALVRVRGEVELFDLAEGSTVGADRGALRGVLPRLLRATLGGSGSPGSCASLITAFEEGGTF